MSKLIITMTEAEADQMIRDEEELVRLRAANARLREALEKIRNTARIAYEYRYDNRGPAHVLSIEAAAQDALAKEGKCQACDDSGIVRSLGRDNDEVIEDCPHCTKKEAKP